MTKEQVTSKFEELIKSAVIIYEKTISQSENPIIDSPSYFKLLSSTKMLFTYLGQILILN